MKHSPKDNTARRLSHPKYVNNNYICQVNFIFYTTFKRAVGSFTLNVSKEKVKHRQA